MHDGRVSYVTQAYVPPPPPQVLFRGDILLSLCYNPSHSLGGVILKAINLHMPEWDVASKLSDCEITYYDAKDFLHATTTSK